MLRTNLSFLSFIEDLYKQQKDSGNIVLKTFAKGNLLLKQGNQATEVFVIKNGVTKCFFNEENGKDFIVEFLGEGEIAGEIEVIRNIPCLCSIGAITEVAAYSIPIPFFKSLLVKSADFNHLILNEMAERIINTSSRSSAQQLYSVENGLRKIRSFQSRNNLTISKEDMAAYLGITLRSLNRVLKDIV